MIEAMEINIKAAYIDELVSAIEKGEKLAELEQIVTNMDDI
ncbi:hypothetical protein [Vagococcus acidifermentans]|nr:hypothetical protein [Vagococcus acidifermentans]